MIRSLAVSEGVIIAIMSFLALTDATVITLVFAIIAAIPPTIASLAALRRVNEVVDKQNRTHLEIADIKVETKELKTLVNGPLGTALGEVASLRGELSEITHDPTQLLKAVAARKASDEHNEIQAAANAERKTTELNKVVIIAELEAKRKPESQEAK